MGKGSGRATPCLGGVGGEKVPLRGKVEGSPRGPQDI